MKLIDSRLRVYKKTWTTYSPEEPRGSGYCANQGIIQILVREYLAFGLPLFKVELDREDVPLWAVLAHDYLGHSEGWSSKFASVIDAQRQ